MDYIAQAKLVMTGKKVNKPTIKQKKFNFESSNITRCPKCNGPLTKVNLFRGRALYCKAHRITIPISM